MAVNEGDFIQLRFTGSYDDVVFDTTEEEKAKEEGLYNEKKTYGPIIVRVGGNHIIPGLDEALQGKEVGESGTVEVPPEKGYGVHDESLLKSAPLKNFAQKPTVGTRISSDGQEGTVVNVIGKRALIDFNHPLAGRTLTYEFTIDAIVEDTIVNDTATTEIYTGRDMDVELNDGVLTVILPPGINYDQRWMMARGMLIHQTFEFIPEIKEVILKESYTRPAPMEEPVTEAEEPEAPAEEDVPAAEEKTE